ncbi:MAG TPA: universal stress protein [Myxococcaceae bacterium]|nr:universal stress protein [Myxococcaceae bacterium]
MLIYGHDFSDSSTSMASAAAALAARLELPLLLVHVHESHQTLEPEAEARIAARARESLESLATELERRWPGCRARALQLRGRPAFELAAVAARERAELLVVASGAHAGPLWRIGTTSERVAVEAECPVLVLRAAEPFEAWALEGRPLRVLLGISDDASCAGGVRWTSRFRAAARCDVIAAEVYSTPEAAERYGLAFRRPWTEPDPEIERLVARDVERRVGSLEGQGTVEIRPVLGLGRSSDHLLDLAERSAADLVIVGTHRARGLPRLASVSGGVLHHGRSSVLLVPAMRERRGTPPELRRVLAAIDLSPVSDLAASHGLALARLARGELHLLHVVDREEPSPSQAVALAARMRALVPETSGVPVRTEVVSGREPAEAITGAAERLDADVVCLVSHARGGLERLALGSVAERVVRTCRRPVLVVHPARE